MTRIEEKLLDTMTVRKWVIAMVVTGVVFCAAGFFAGRAHLKYELRTGLEQVFKGFQAPK